ncbi:MAG: hypothetical protein RMX96_08120 [Nostoc sp. ChiSLP02]|nr:hypothetical protein [Nostoc sp. DedSLP05]MDZ8102603.1 hypothetical protein [Nostoc sp. DedSLP01]MDZ8184801.1 hypothetical protein [Nostoc sp. ChiSLP02]
MTTKITTQMQTYKYPFAQEMITDMEGNIRKVVIDFDDYLHLLEIIENEGIILAMKAVKYEIPLNIDEALAQLEQK